MLCDAQIKDLDGLNAIPDEYKPKAVFLYPDGWRFPRGIGWGFWRSSPYPDHAEYSWYFYWWNWLEKKHRYFGPYDMYYDGIHKSTYGSNQKTYHRHQINAVYSQAR